MFKWEKRKGPEFLIQSYFTEFKKKEDVCLIFLTYIPGYTYESRKVSIDSKINLILETYKINRTDLPCYHIINEQISTSDMPSLYKSVDSFVLPTRGEGIKICN